MLKWVGRFLFIMFVFIATVPVLQYANMSMYEKFYNEEMSGEENIPEEYLIGVSTIFNFHYFQKTPILSYSFNGDQNIDVQIYLFGTKIDKDYINGFLIYPQNISVRDNDNQLIENPLIKIRVDLNTNINDQNSSINTFYEREYDYSGPIPIRTMFFGDNESNTDPNIDGTKVLNYDIYAGIKSITIMFSDGTVDEDNNTVYENLLYIADEIFDEPSLNPLAYHYAEIEFLGEDYQLRDQFAESEPTDAEIIAFNLSSDKDNIKAYYWIIWRTIIIYILIVLVIAYFLFIHKHVMERRRNKIYDAQSNNPNKIVVDAIFKDEVENTKDGK